MEEQECESCWSQSLCFSHWTRTELRWELPSCFTQCLAKSLCLLIILKYLRSKSVILSVPMASIFLFSFFFKKWLKIAQKSSTCSLIKMQAIKVCDEVKKNSLSFSPLHSQGVVTTIIFTLMSKFSFSVRRSLLNSHSNLCYTQMLIYRYFLV